jgi:hypothetical protein
MVLLLQNYKRNANKILVRKLGEEIVGRARYRWEDHLAQDRV